jgi:MFS family permease
MSSLAILLLVRQHTGSFAYAGLTVGAFTLSGAAAAPLQGALVDRHGGHRVLMPFAAAQAAALVGLVLASQARAATAAVVVIAGSPGPWCRQWMPAFASCGRESHRNRAFSSPPINWTRPARR